MFNYVTNDVGPDPDINSVGDIIGMSLNVLIGVGVSASVIFIGLAGIRFIMSQGNPDEVDRAKNALTYSIAALVLSVGAIAIKNIIYNMLGITGADYVNPTPTF